jgi:hypothetical protein
MAMRARPAAVLVACLVLIAGCAGGAVSPQVTADGLQRIEVAYFRGAVTGGVVRYTLPLGSPVQLVVASDVADEVHVHGYDRRSFVTAGAATTLRFTADLPGVFEVELEQRGAPLTELEVS